MSLAVVGCGGTGSAFLSGLPHLGQAMRAFGHPGLEVTVYDGERVAASNSVRQPFSVHDVGRPKACVLATRLNLFWGTAYAAVPRHAGPGTPLGQDVVVGCVDTRTGRAAMRALTEGPEARTRIVLDCGNGAGSGQVVLGMPDNPANHPRRGGPVRLPCAWDLFPEVADASLDAPGAPSCSALESLTRQGPFVNQSVAAYALALLSQLLCGHVLSRHGGFVNVGAGTASALPVDEDAWRRLGYPPRPPRRAGAAGPAPAP